MLIRSDSVLRLGNDPSPDSDSRTTRSATPTRTESRHNLSMDSERRFLRHAVATLAYRAAKALRDAPPTFAAFSVAPGSRTPAQIVAHMGDLLDWALFLARGEQSWRDSMPLPWEQEVQRFFRALEAFDAYLASEHALGWSAERLFQGPIADALTHTGQLTMLRRLAGAPVRGENYARAMITAGTVGLAQGAPAVEFD